jgi:hypothetical protein
LLLLSPGIGRAEDAAWLKYTHHRYAGFTFGNGTIHTFSYDLTETSGGKLVLKGHVVRAALAYREDVQWAKENVDSSDGFTGKVFWYSDENGFATRLGGNDVPLTYAEDLIETDAIATLPWTYERTVTEAGADLAVVRVTLDNGFSIDLYVDRATGAYRRVVLDPDGAYEQRLRTITYVEPRPGLRVVAAMQAGDVKDVTTVANIQLNPFVGDADLQPPVRSAQWSFGTSAIPVTLTHDRIVVQATVNGVKGTFLLDTGAAGIFLSGAFARRAHVAQATGHTTLWSLYGAEKSDIGRVDTLQIGDSILAHALVYYGMESPDVWGPDGLLGYGALAGAYVSINLKDATMTLRNATDVDPAAEGGTVVPASFAGGQPVIGMLLNDSLHFDAIVDTGNPGGVVIPAAVVVGYGLRLRGGTYCGQLDTLSIGEIKYESPDACMAMGGGGRILLAGMDFLKKLDRIDFDYPIGALVLFPKK